VRSLPAEDEDELVHWTDVFDRNRGLPPARPMAAAPEPPSRIGWLVSSAEQLAFQLQGLDKAIEGVVDVAMTEVRTTLDEPEIRQVTSRARDFIRSIHM
jgi:hypothetical protein